MGRCWLVIMLVSVIVLVMVMVEATAARYLEEEIKNLKEIMGELEGKLEEFNNLYLEKLEVQVKEMASRLEHLDKNVVALHERSVAWEKVARSAGTWEEFLKAIETKVELVQKGQDNIAGGQAVTRAMTATASNRLDAVDIKMGTLFKRTSDESIAAARRQESLMERLIRLEGRAAQLQDGQQKLTEAIQDLHGFGHQNSVGATTTPPVILTTTTRPVPTPSDDVIIPTPYCDAKFIDQVVGDILEAVTSADIDDPLEGHDARRMPRSRRPEVMFRKLWRKFQNPVSKINRRLETLEQLSLQTNLVCNQSYNVNTKVQHAVTRGECVQVNYELRRFSIRTDEQLSKLENKIARQMAKLGKLMERASRDGTLATQSYPSSCDEVQDNGYTVSGIYTIQPSYDDKWEAYCDLDTEGGGWTVIQRRGNFGFKPENFNRDWEGYRHGFGDSRSEFWIGNDRLHELTQREDMVLRIEMEDWDGVQAFAEYMKFKVASEEDYYLLHIGNYSGNASDSFSAHHGKFFSTYDQTHDEAPVCCPCARTYLGGWWFYSCFEAHLNGPFHSNPVDNDYYLGIIWEHWRGDYSLKSSEMKIRPRVLHFRYTGKGGPIPEDP